MSGPTPDQAEQHMVTLDWDEDTGEVVMHECSCGERWRHDNDRCPQDDSLDDVMRDDDIAIPSIAETGREFVCLDPVELERLRGIEKRARLCTDPREPQHVHITARYILGDTR